MLALTHFATGAALGIGIAGPFVDEQWRPALMVASGIWAMGPDLNKFLPGLDWLHNNLWANVRMGDSLPEGRSRRRSGISGLRNGVRNP